MTKLLSSVTTSQSTDRDQARCFIAASNRDAVVAGEAPHGVAFGATKHKQRLEDAATVIEEVMSTPDKAIPQNLLDKAHCVVIIPDLKKGAFIFGARYGKGYLTCRKDGGEGWSAPATVRVEGGSFGLQLGVTETDVIMLVMNSRGADKLMASEFTVGGTAEAAALSLTHQKRLRSWITLPLCFPKILPEPVSK